MTTNDHSPTPPNPAGPGARSTSGMRQRVTDAGRTVGRGGRAGIRAVGTGGRAAGRRFRSFASADGAADTGLARLTELHAVNVAADAALTVSLAGTVFALPTDEARSRVALFLVLTMAPFVLLAPLIGPLLDRFRHGRRWALGTTLATRAFLAWVLASAVVEDSAWLFPAALGCLVASRSYAVARAALSRIGPDWSLRLAFAIYVSATVLAIRLPARVDSTTGEVDVDGIPVSEAPLPTLEGGPRRLRALPPLVRFTLWVTCGARVLSGFLTLFLAFLMREHPIPGWSGPVVLALVAGAAGAGNALGSVIGNRRRTPPPERMATAIALVALSAALATSILYSVWALVLLGLATGLFGQLAKLCLDALIQRDIADDVRARVFSWSETILQGFWVLGGAIGIAIPLRPGLGFGLVAVVVALLGAVAIRSRHLGSGR